VAHLAARTVAVAACSLAVLAATAPAASAKTCRGVKDRQEGAIFRVRVSSAFPCSGVRTNLRSWLGFGAPMRVGRPLLPGGWTCGPPHTNGTRGIRYFCRLRTSFGGTKPLRTYRLNFRYDPYVG
jgi:hypothetical protein